MQNSKFKQFAAWDPLHWDHQRVLQWSNTFGREDFNTISLSPTEIPDVVSFSSMGIPASFRRHLWINPIASVSGLNALPNDHFQTHALARSDQKLNSGTMFQSVETISCWVPLNSFRVRLDQRFNSCDSIHVQDFGEFPAHILPMRLCRLVIVPSQECWEKFQMQFMSMHLATASRRVLGKD